MKTDVFRLFSLTVMGSLLPLLGAPLATAQAQLSAHPAIVTSSASVRVESAPTATARTRVMAALQNAPVLFIENQGQLDERVAYYIQGSDKTLYFTPGGVTFALTAPVTATQSLPLPDLAENAVLDRTPEATATQRWVVKLEFVGANPDLRPVGEDRAETIISYFKGPKDEWHTGLPTYHRIVYHELWPGIDLIYFGAVNRMKYEFVVQPGADPDQIRMVYRGAGRVALNEAGQVDVTTPLGGFRDDTPVGYQDVGGSQVEVPVSYALDRSGGAAQLQVHPRGRSATMGMETGAGGVAYGFRVGDYDTSLPLVLDPAMIVYCGYIGGNYDDSGQGIAVDRKGYAYVTGFSRSEEGFPVAVGPDLTHDNRADAFVAKVRADGTGLVYCGYIGGSNGDTGDAIAVDQAGNAYVTGWTESGEASFPVTVGPDLTHSGTSDAFVAKVRPDGTGLVYCGYIGGSSEDHGMGIAVDGAGNAYVAGYTYSETGFPATVGPDLSYNKGIDAFVAKVRADGTGLVYAGYIGGSGEDEGSGIAVDSVGSAYVTGYTYSTQSTFPVTVGPDLTHNGGDSDAFIVKVRPDGTGFAYAGYIGGSSREISYGIAVDSAGNAYVAGETRSTQATFPVGIGPDVTHNGGSNGGSDAFVAKVRADGTGLVYCGFLGGPGEEAGRAIAVDRAGNAFIAGDSSYGFPVTVGPGDIYGDWRAAFVVQVRADGTGLIYARYINGRNDEYAYGIAVDGAGNAYVTGWTYSKEDTFPAAVGPDLTFNGASYIDAFVAKVGGTAWTLMFYLDGDNNLDRNYVAAFNQLEAAANNPNVDIVVAWDRSANGNSAYYEVQHDMNLGEANPAAHYTDGVNRWAQGELRMNDPATLSDFVQWARTNYPAQHYALVVSDHGTGLGGLATDSSSAGDWLTVKEWGTALADATSDGSDKIDVVFADACLMAMIEDAYQIRNYADYYVASENLIWIPAGATSGPYDDYVSGIGETTSPRDLAVALASSYRNWLDADFSSFGYTISVADLARMGDLVSATSALASDLNGKMHTYGSQISDARADTQKLDSLYPKTLTQDDTYVDLYDFAHQVKNHVADPAIKDKADSVMAAVQSYIIAEAHRDGVLGPGTSVQALGGCHGVSVFFPPNASSFYNSTRYDFATGTTWPGGGSQRSASGIERDLSEVEWGPMLVAYFAETQPGGPNTPEPPSLASPIVAQPGVRLPLVLRSY